MYRLNNPRMEDMIDWLVLNGKLDDREVVVSPWNEDGMGIYRYYSLKWGGRCDYCR